MLRVCLGGLVLRVWSFGFRVTDKDNEAKNEKKRIYSRAYHRAELLAQAAGLIPEKVMLSMRA